MKPMRTTIQVSALLVGVAAALVAHDAHALGPLDLEIGAKAGVGTAPGGTSNGPNPLGFGVGGRAGVSILGLYGGISGIYYLGESKSVTSGPVSASVSAHSILLGLEAGYGSKIGPLSLRGTVGIGNIETDYSGGAAAPGFTLTIPNGSNNGLYIEPGVTGIVALGLWFIGADANALILPDYPGTDGSKSLEAAFTIHGQLGVKF
jgi:hypothetical protein